MLPRWRLHGLVFLPVADAEPPQPWLCYYLYFSVYLWQMRLATVAICCRLPVSCAEIKEATEVTEEMDRPLEEVVASYGEDGWCLYGSLGTWASECAVSRKTRNVRPFVKQFQIGYKIVSNAPNAVPVTLKFPDQSTLTLRDHFYPLDDVYCFVNGWYSFPDRGALLYNFSYLEEVSDRECNKLKQELPEYHSLSAQDLMAESVLDEEVLQAAMGGLGHVPELTVRGMRIHAAAKCLMRGQVSSVFVEMIRSMHHVTF
eukprot:Skav225490  [mRNA]  locus=scaffold1360:22538:30923:- [translate_table: standard]